MWKKEQTANERNRFFWKVKDRLSHYLKMEKMLIVVCCITYTIVMLIIGHVFNHRLLEEYCQLVNNTISKELETENRNWENYQVLAGMVMSDGELLRMFDEEVSSDYILSATYKLGKYKQLIPNTYDIYLYNAGENMIFSTIGMKRELSADELVADEFLEQLGNRQYGYHKNFLVYDNHGEEKAIAHVLYLSKMKQRFLIILEDYQSYCETYAYCEETTGADIIVTNASGEVIVGSKEYPVGSYIGDMTLFGNRKNAYDIERLNNIKSVINYVDNGKESSRVVIAIRPYAQIITNNPFDSKWIPLYLVLGLLVTQVLAMEGWIKHYVKRMRDKLAEKKVPDAEKIYLLEYLENPLLEVPKRVQAFCDDKFGAGKKLGFLIFRLDTYKEIKKKYSAEDVDLYRFALNNILEEVFSEKAVILNLRRSGPDVLYMYSLHEDASPDSLVEAAETCREYIHKYIDFDTSYFISDAAEQDKMLEKYSEVYHILEYAFIYGFNSTLLADVTQSEKKGNLKEVLKMCDNLSKCIEENNDDKVMILNEVITSMSSLDSIEVHDAGFRLIIVVANALKKCENREYSGGLNIVLPEVITKLSEARNLEEVQTLIHNLLNQVDEIQEHAVEIKRYDKYVNRVQEMIAQKYSYPDLYIETIAAELGITGKHLGKIYKAATGDTISHALVNKRLEEAEKLLLEGDMGIREIALAVGYTEESCNYFSTLFKKKYGKTPSDYRMDKRMRMT